MSDPAKRMLCSAALAYPRAELPFVAEWLDYHLSLGVDHVFLGIHANEEFKSAEALMPAKRPFPAMYVLGGTEGDVLAEFYDRIAPFRGWITTFLFRRDDHRLRTHNTAQLDLYRHVRDRCRNDFEWVAIHDIDEFLVPQIHDDLPAALRALPDHVASLRMRQVICEARWNEDHSPVEEPVLSRQRRLTEVIPATHGGKAISRLSRVKHLYIHHAMVDGETVCDDSILHYHFRGFPARTEIETGHPLPISAEDFDAVDDRPSQLLQLARLAGLQRTSCVAPLDMRPEAQEKLVFPWRISDRLMLFIRDQLPTLAPCPSGIIELGPGYSTLVLSRTFPDAKIVSIEHDERWLGTSRKLLAQTRSVELRLAPLDPATRWYQIEPGSLPPADLLLVDGPPGHIAPAAREGALILAPRLRQGALVILDDTDRPDERHSIAKWQALGFEVIHEEGRFCVLRRTGNPE